MLKQKHAPKSAIKKRSKPTTTTTTRRKMAAAAAATPKKAVPPQAATTPPAAEAPTTKKRQKFQRPKIAPDVLSADPSAPLPAFSTVKIGFTQHPDIINPTGNGQVTFTPAQRVAVVKSLSDPKSMAPTEFMSQQQPSYTTIRNPELDRKGFNVHNAQEDNFYETGVRSQLPSQSVLVLPVSSRIGRKYVDDIRSGKVVEQMYKEITKTKDLQEVYTPSHTYVHWFRLHERNQRDFLKRLGLIETKLNQRFGSTYYLHVSKAIRKYRKRFTILRSPFVHKKAQDTYEYNHHEFICRVSYAFAITDPEINDFMYEQLKSQVLASGGGISFGWDVKLSKPRVRRQLYTPLSSSIINTSGTNPDIEQIKYANYVGQQELLRQHCEANSIDYEKYGGDSNLFPLRDDLLRFRDRKLKLIKSGMTPSEAEKQAFGETDVSELSDPTYSESSDDAFKIMHYTKM